jgi:hypothetical protein
VSGENKTISKNMSSNNKGSRRMLGDVEVLRKVSKDVKHITTK